MISAGVNIGSGSMEFIVLDDGNIWDVRKTDTGIDPIGQVKKMIDGTNFDAILATEYGRTFFEIENDYCFFQEEYNVYRD